MAVKTKLVPPNGGYGWFIAGAYSLHQLLALPTLFSYGLLFKDTFRDLGFTATDVTFVMNTHVALSMFMGMANGPLIRRFGYRKMSVVGAFLFTFGIIATSFANTRTQYLITYSIITALGIGVGLASYPVAFNSYFTTKRAKAAGYALTISGIGIVSVPQLLSYLLSAYGIKGTCLIMGAINSHVFIAAILLQPVKRYMKKEIIEEDSPEAVKERLLAIDENVDDNLNNNKQIAKSQISLEDELEIDSKYNVAAPFGSMLSLHSVMSRTRSAARNLNQAAQEQPKPTQNKIHSQKDLSVKEKDPFHVRIGKQLVDTFDLTLLKDPIYVNILLGLSIALFSEMNFQILTPFIMNDYGLSIQEIATFLSTMAISDICFRLMAPYVSDFFRASPRIVYLWILLVAILARFSLFISDNFYVLLVSACLLGLTRGFRTVNLALIIPNHVPIERLASALGLQSTTNGILIWMGAPFFGFLKNVTGSYKNCIYVLNLITFIPPVMWSVEFIYLRIKSKKKQLELEEGNA